MHAFPWGSLIQLQDFKCHLNSDDLTLTSAGWPCSQKYWLSDTTAYSIAPPRFNRPHKLNVSGRHLSKSDLLFWCFQSQQIAPPPMQLVWPKTMDCLWHLPFPDISHLIHQQILLTLLWNTSPVWPCHLHCHHPSGCHHLAFGLTSKLVSLLPPLTASPFSKKHPEWSFPHQSIHSIDPTGNRQWIPTALRIKSKVLSMACEALHDLSPGYISKPTCYQPHLLSLGPTPLSSSLLFK